MYTINGSYIVRQCSKCAGDTEYSCLSCPSDLCAECRENHIHDLDTIDHNVVIYREKIHQNSTGHEVCSKHPDNDYEMYCERCELPVCFYCAEHRTHKWQNIQRVYQIKRQHHSKTFQNIRNEAILYMRVFLPEIKADVKFCHTQFCLYRSKMLAKVQKIINGLGEELHNLNFKHACLTQKIETMKHLTIIQSFVQKYEQSGRKPTQFLLFMRKIRLSDILCTHYATCHSVLSMTEVIKKEEVAVSVSEIQITDRGKRQIGNDERLLKLVSNPELHRCVEVKGVRGCSNISCMTSELVWISDSFNNLILTNTAGDTLHYRDDLCSDYGSHTVNKEKEFIYIDRNYNIIKLSKDMKTTTITIKKMDTAWIPRCICWSSLNQDLLLGMYRKDLRKGIVTRYSQSGKLTQIIQKDNTGLELYNDPRYITENENGDVVVSDSIFPGAVVAIDRNGTHRFSYTGHPPGSELMLWGISTDALSHILLCDKKTNTVQMIDKDGQFLSHLLIRPSWIFIPHSLSYDENTHRLWVGSEDNNVVGVFKYITRQITVTGQLTITADVNQSEQQIKDKETSNTTEENKLKWKSPPKIHQLLTVSEIEGCNHISFVTSNGFWISDYKNSLILTNTKGETLHHLDNLYCGELYSDSLYSDSFHLIGSHTVNNESELFYIDKDYSINKLSKEMRTTSTFLEYRKSTWRPRCLCWSPSRGDLLVGMIYGVHRKTGRVTRYNQTGQLIQIIQHDEIGQDLYSKPNYVKENKNGDVVVSDSFTAVVVTEREGRYRFSYTGHPSGSGLMACGICTDELSHILVCDNGTETVHMIDKDGQFLSHLLTRSQEIGEPLSVNYDINTHNLWVGSWHNNTLCVYKYLNQQNILSDTTSKYSAGNTLSSLSQRL